MQHYGCEPERTNARCANENGDVESANGHIKDRLDQALLLRGLRVSSSSTIQVRTNTYSVPSRLIGVKVDVRIGAEQIIVTHQDHHVQTMKRLVGKHGQSINYRHVIDSLLGSRRDHAFGSDRHGSRTTQPQ